MIEARILGYNDLYLHNTLIILSLLKTYRLDIWNTVDYVSH